MSNHNIFISAGDFSGDEHAAGLMKKLQKTHPNCNFTGIGGDQLAACGVTLLTHLDQIAVMGITDVLLAARRLWRTWCIIKRHFATHQPSLVILVDYPGLNMRIAKLAHDSGAKVLYFISPKVWAWGAKRIQQIRCYVDHMAVIFPFEVDIYRANGVPVTFVGNPLLERMDLQPTSWVTDKFNQSATKTKQRIIGLLPGSRDAEVGRILPHLLAAAHALHARHANLEFHLAFANDKLAKRYQKLLTGYALPLVTSIGQARQVMQRAHLLLIASGTATLEAALCGTPMIIVYRLHLVSYWFAKINLRVNFVGLPNILLGANVVPELLQTRCNSELIAEHANILLSDSQKLSTMSQKLLVLQDKLAHSSTSSTNLYKLCIELLG